MYPTRKQEGFVGRIFGAVRWVKNNMLEFRSRAFRRWKIRISGMGTQTLLKFLKEEPEYAWLNEIPSQSLQVATQELDKAYQGFFNGTTRYPRFKKKNQKQSFTIPQPRIRLRGNNGWLFIPNFKTWVPFVYHSEFRGETKSATVMMDHDGTYHVSFVVKVNARKFNPAKSQTIVGLDLGINHFVVLSDGTKIQAPKPLRSNLALLKRLQRSLSRMVRNSENYKKLRKRIARLHSRIARQREDFLHQLSNRLVDENQVIAIEDLNVKGMLKNRRLARSIADLGWGKFIAILKYKCLWRGRSLRIISRWFPSSKMCSRCGEVNETLTLKDREWTCPCGAHHDRDINAAINIKNVGRDTPEYKPEKAKKPLRQFAKRKTSDSAANGGGLQVASQGHESGKNRELICSLVASVSRKHAPLGA